MERLLLPDLYATLPMNSSQHGFRSNRSTVTALMHLSTTITRGFNAAKPATRTGLLSIDISKAFDVVQRDLLLQKLGQTGLHSNIKRWFLAYLVDRRVRVRYQDKLSKWLKSKLGMLQGAVTSPPLWNFFTLDLKVESADVDESFADDFHAGASSPDVEEITGTLNVAAVKMVRWANENDMLISAPKSSVTLFTPWTRQVNTQLDVKINDNVVPTNKYPKLLGVTFDPLHTFSHHVVSIMRRASSRLNMMRALADTSFGKDKECLVLTFKAFNRSLFDYCAPIVYPIYSPSSIKRLQKVQNKALRLVLGCHNAASFEHLHVECQELPVKEHLHLLSAQFLARSLQPSHPSHHYAQLDQGHRQLKHTLRSKVIEDVRPYLESDGTAREGSFSYIKNAFHTDIVSKVVRDLAPNRVLGHPPVAVSKSEIYLPRLIRATLSQLRSGACACLKDFQLKLGKVQEDTCSVCGLFPETVKHLFDCPARPTQLCERDLWDNPREAADFLSSHPAFDFPPLGSPPRLRKRPRPPSLPPDTFSPLLLPPLSPLFPPPIPPLIRVEGQWGSLYKI